MREQDMSPEARLRRLFQAAAAAERRQGPTKRSRPPEGRTTQTRGAPKTYCVRCFAMLKQAGCPRCDLHESNFFMFCRRCLNVHGSLQPCKEWRPKHASHSDD